MKHFFTIILYLLINMGAAERAFTQNTLNLPVINHHSFIPSPLTKQRSSTPISQSKNEVEGMLYILFDIYKNWFSSQDLNSCSFYPSCSSYGLQSVKKYGVVMGMVRTFDRLSRCHGFSTELYEIDLKNRVQIDYP